VIGGMLAASLIAIFLIPVMFYIVERLRGEKRRQREELTQIPQSGETLNADERR
jgi:hypothetical protein